MEKAILKTIIYADIFNFSLKGWEIHKWLIGTKCDLIKVQKAIDELIKKNKIQESRGYYFLPSKAKLVARRIKNHATCDALFKKARLVATVFRIIPWIKLVGVSGALAMNNAGKSDDIDLFIITNADRMWTCRLLALGIIGLLGLRRTVHDTNNTSAGKICLNLILEESALEQKSKNLYTAHEVLQMKLLWQRDDMYAKFLSANAWVFKFLPNWVGSIKVKSLPAGKAGKNIKVKNSVPKDNLLENLAKKFQLKIMQTPTGDERIEDHALYFHPQDHSKRVLPLDRSVSV